VPRSQRDGSLRPYSRLSRPEPLLIVSSNSSIVKVGYLHPVACTRSGSGFPSNATLV
jgi:hypothetical protein